MIEDVIQDRSYPGSAAAEQPALGGDERGYALFAEALAQHRAQIADGIDQPQLARLHAGPELTGKQGRIGAGELGAAASPDQSDEHVVDLALDRLQAFHILWLLRQEGIQHGLVLARRIETPLHADLVEQAVESQRPAHHAAP